MTKETFKKKSSMGGQALLELAVDCKLITVPQEKEILPQLLEFSKKNPEKSPSVFLLKNQIFSEENIEFLYSIKKHLELLMADKKFGKLGVANHFVAPDKINKALDLQVEIFRKRKKSIKIGDILVQNHDMSVADKTALLLTQDRIKDELLADALNAIAKSKIEQIAINKRFGAIAVKKELIDTKQLNQALKAQQKEEKEGKKKRYLGDFLKELFSVSDNDILDILKIQKKLETKRMNLEKNLTQYNCEKNSNQALDAFYEYHVTEDKLKAFVGKTQKTAQKTPLDDFLNWFSLSGIKYGLCDTVKVQAFLARDEVEAQLEIAKGKAPRAFENELIDYHFDIHFFDDKEDRKAEDAPLVKKNDVLATITPHKEAEPGKDVFGRPIFLPEEPVIFVGAGQGVVKRKNEFIALSPGHPKLFKNRTLFVTPAMDLLSDQVIDGDITTDATDEYLSCNLNVKGNIIPGIHVACHNLIIEGDIMGNVIASGNIDIKGGIGMESSKDEKNSHLSRVEAKGSIQVSQKIINSNIVAKQGLKAPNSDLVSSRVLSCNDIVVNNIFSSRDAPSILRLTRENAIEIEKIEKAIRALKKGLDKLLHKPELDQLSKELMAQVQVQNGYLEKQNVMLYLNRISNDPKFNEINTMDQKIKASEDTAKTADANQISIAVNTKAHRFMELILGKVKLLDEKNQQRYIQEFYNNIAALYKTAVKGTERIHKKYDARSRTIDVAIKKAGPKIDKITRKIDMLNSQKDLLLLDQERSKERSDPVLKVKNQMGIHTIVWGEKAKMVVDETIYRVSVKEDRKTQASQGVMRVQGFFE